jgi:putative NADH-flavin reductase
MMKLLIFGATGGTGHEIMTQALEQNHIVTVFVRNPDKVKLVHSNLRIVQGDILDYKSVIPAVEGQDVILSALGIRILKKNTIISDGTKHILHAAEDTGVKRLICMSAIGIGESKAQQNRLGPLYNRFMIPLLLRNMFADKEIQEAYIMNSNTDWTLVRAAILTNGPKSGRYRICTPYDQSVTAKISRSDVADFMLKQSTDDSMLRKAVSISD